jgi:hypothetical protein
LIAFIQAKIQRLDNANKPPIVITESLSFSSGPIASIHLGSPKKKEKKVVLVTVGEFAKDLGRYGAKQFRGMLEDFLNNLYVENQESYIQVKGSQLVISKFLLGKISCLLYFTDSRVPVPGNQLQECG